MFTPKENKASGDSCPAIPSSTQSGSTCVKESRFMQLEQASKNLFRSSIRKKDHTISNAIAYILFGSIGVLVPQDHQGSTKPVSVNSSLNDLSLLPNVAPQHPISPSAIEANSKDLTHSASIILQPTSTALSAAASGDKTSIFPRNVPAPSLQVSLPAPGARLETSMQLAYCNQLLRTHLSLSSATISITVGQDPSQQASADTLLRNMEEQQKIRELAIRVVEEFVTDGLKNAEEIAEVVLLGPFLTQEYYRKLLNCFIGEFEAAKLLDIDLLQGLVQLVQCAGHEYRQPDDLVRILVVLRTRLQDTHQQTTNHPYYLTLALSRLLDVMVEGKVQDLSRIVDHEPLSSLLDQLMESSDPYLKHLASYAHQGLLHVPNDETRRQFVLRHAGNIAMGLLGVVSVCNLDLNGFSEESRTLRDATVSALEIGTEVVGGARTLYESGQGISASVKGGIFSGARLIWYTALREAQEHIQNGRLSNFNRLVFEAPCSGDVEFQWGVCQLVGEIAVDPQWEVSTRQYATELLAELYRNNLNKDLDIWILQIIRQVVTYSDAATSSHSQLLLQSLDKKGDIGKQALYRDVMDGPLSHYPLLNHFPTPSPSPLLARVQGVPDVEYDIHRLRMQRLEEPQSALYIPPQAKPTLQSPDDTLFPLMEKTLAFLMGSGQVFLLLGDSGGGKSTFNLQLEHTLWKDYKRGGAIPIHINLPAIDNPQQDMIAKQLQQLHLFSEAQIQELRQSRQFIVICDGYDECQLKKNLYDTNHLNKPGQWTAKMVISCRSQYLGIDYHSYFQPTGDRYQQAVGAMFQMAVIASFSRSQIEQYVEQYVQQVPQHAVYPMQTSWTVKDYMDKLLRIPKLIELVSNPFLLTLALRAVIRVVGSGQDLSSIRLSHVGLYDNFITQWLESEKLRLVASTLSQEAQAAFRDLLDANFIQEGLRYQKDLAAAIFQHQDGHPVVKYTQLRDRWTWKAGFFGTDAMTTILRESSPLTRSGNQFRFIHRSILEYLYSRVISDPIDPQQLSEETEPSSVESSESFVGHSLNQRSIIGEPLIMQFLAERVDLDPLFKARLHDVIEDSKVDAQVSQAASNAISILVKAGVLFNGADLRGIRIPGATLRGAQFDSADLEGANLRGVNLSGTWLRQATLSNTQMSEVQFEELPYIKIGVAVQRCAFSANGEYLAVATQDCKIFIYNTSTWTRINDFPGGPAFAISPTTSELAKSGECNTVELGNISTGGAEVVLVGHSDWITEISYSPDGNQVATSSDDTTIRLWDVLTGDTVQLLRGHSEAVKCVAFSPTGLQVVSGGEDMTVIVWSAQTGDQVFLVNNHLFGVNCVAYSPDGHRIASGDWWGAVVVWDIHEDRQLFGFESSCMEVFDITFSPDGRQIASCGADFTVRLRDSNNGDPIKTLSGHAGVVTSVVYSPCGDYVVSGAIDHTIRLWATGRVMMDAGLSDSVYEWQCVAVSPNGMYTASSTLDGLIQLWDTRTGRPRSVLKGHSEGVKMIAFSPCSEKIASCNYDGTVRLWRVQTGECVYVYKGHTGELYDVAFTPDGRQIASAGEDKTVHIWNPQTGEVGCVLKGHVGRIFSVAFSPDGDRIASCSDYTIRLWDPSTREALYGFYVDFDLRRITFSPSGHQMFPVATNGAILHCWDTQTGKHIGSHLNKPSLLCLAFAPIDNLVATVGEDGVLRLWDCGSDDDWVEVFQTEAKVSVDIVWVDDADGKYLATFNFGSVRVWELKVIDGAYTLQMLWSIGRNELSLHNTIMSNVDGLSPVDLELVKQRGAILESKV